MLSMSEAATRTGLSKSTIHRAIKGGKLSAERQEDGAYEIDAAELFRVYRPAQPEAPRPAGHHATPSDTAETASGTDWDAVEAHLRELLEIERRRGEELREERDAWRAQAERLALMAPVPAPAPAATPEHSAEPKPALRGFLGLFGRRAA